MAAKKGTGKGRNSMLGGAGSDVNPKAIIKEIMAEVGGPKAIAGHISKYLNDSNSNVYLQSRSVQNVMKLLVMAGTDDGEETELLDEEDLEIVVMKDTLRFFVTMPEDVFVPLFARIIEKRRELAAVNASARQALEIQQRPLDAPHPVAG